VQWQSTVRRSVQVPHIAPIPQHSEDVSKVRVFYNSRPRSSSPHSARESYHFTFKLPPSGFEDSMEWESEQPNQGMKRSILSAFPCTDDGRASKRPVVRVLQTGNINGFRGPRSADPAIVSTSNTNSTAEAFGHMSISSTPSNPASFLPPTVQHSHCSSSSESKAPTLVQAYHSNTPSFNSRPQVSNSHHRRFIDFLPKYTRTISESILLYIIWISN
jgi:hypothetical protein